MKKTKSLLIIPVIAVIGLALIVSSQAASKSDVAYDVNKSGLNKQSQDAFGGSYVEFRDKVIGVETEINPYNYKVVKDFNAEKNLPNAKSVGWYNDWWTGYNNQDSWYEDPPYVTLRPANIRDTNENGTYSYARAGGHFIMNIVEFLRLTGDPNALTELEVWSDTLATNLKDHDGRGYVFFEEGKADRGAGYGQPLRKDGLLTDTIFLEEGLLGGNIALIAHALHQNRDVSPGAGERADFWFDYLANNFVPKWTMRATANNKIPYTPEIATSDVRFKYTPPAELGLENAIDWDHWHSGAQDRHPSWDPHRPIKEANKIKGWTPAYVDSEGPNHQFAVYDIAHVYISQMAMYHYLSEYFDSGEGAITSKAFDPAMFELEAKIRHDWWFQQTKKLSDGSRVWYIDMATQTGNMYTNRYSIHIAKHSNALHWDGFESFADDAVMAEHADAYYAGPTSKNNVFKPGNYKNMAGKIVGGGLGTGIRVRSQSSLGTWDEHGVILEVTQGLINSPVSHNIDAGTKKYDSSHYNGLLNHEIRTAFGNR